jgi:predicted Zn-dependent peptidase
MISIHTLSNGLTLIVEQIDHVESVAYDLHIPGGMTTDELGYEGSSLLLTELTSRGAGGLDSRALSNSFDDLGISHSESSGHDRFFYRGALLAEHLPQALKNVAAMVREPHLPAEEIESIRSLLLQDIGALNDNPARRAGIELSARYYPPPYNRSPLGTIAGLSSCSREYLERDWRRRFQPEGAILSVAGKVSAPQIVELVENTFGAWRGTGVTVPPFGPLPPHGSFHIHDESAQLQIVLAYPSCPFGHSDFYTAKVATGVLSGGMFGRLFIEVREKRGLVYSVFARHSATRDYGTMTAYAGTTPERAQETLEVMLRELRGLHGSASEEELERSKANLKASLIIGEESTGARASSNASDWWLDKRVRSHREIQAGIDGVTRESIDRYLGSFPAARISLLTLGARELSMSGGDL